jgi:hypothetical protein
MDYFFSLNGMKIGLITFLIPGQDRAFCRWEHAVENHLQGGVSFDDYCSTKRMKEAFKATCKPKMARIYDNQDSKRCTWSEQGTHQSSYATTNGLEMNMVTLVSKMVWHFGKLITARLRLVVAKTLHKQLSSFRLHILSNTPSCLEESHKWNLLLIQKACAFYFTILARETPGRTGTIQDKIAI